MEAQCFPAKEAQVTHVGATELSGGMVMIKRDMGNRGSVHLSSSLECPVLRPGAANEIALLSRSF